jgi:hypothetical protein
MRPLMSPRGGYVLSIVKVLAFATEYSLDPWPLFEAAELVYDEWELKSTDMHEFAVSAKEYAFTI